MKQYLKKSAQVIVVAITAVALSACAAPATKTINLSEAELRHEQKLQNELAKQNPKPKKLVRKHKELFYYQNRLNKAAHPLALAAKKLCTSGTCTYKFKVVDRPGLNAWTDGKSVVFTPIMMDFLESDKELAVVIAHELSHNVMGHHGKQQQNMILGTLLDIAAATQGVNTGGLFGSIGSVSYSQGFENEADYVAIYIMALAGYDISNVHHIWRKFTVHTRSGTDVSFFSSHPSNPERFIRMQRTIAEVQAKQKSGKKLVPNFKT